MDKMALNYIYLSPQHAGGKDQVGLNLLKGFEELGATKDMIVFCHDYSTELIREIAPNIQVVEIPSKRKKAKSELARMFEVLCVNTFKMPKLVKKYNIDLVFHLSCNTGLKKLPAKSIVLPHDIKAVSHRILAGIKIPLYKYWIYRIMYYFDFKHNDAIVAISDVDKHEISMFYAQFADKVFRIYNPIDIIKPKSIGRAGLTNNIVAINVQFHHKNILTLIKAFEKIMNQIDAQLILVGNVPQRMKYLQEYVERHQLKERVLFTGFVSEEQKNDLLKTCRLYVNPTLYEGFGMTAVEALILGVPTLLSKIPANYEVTQGLCEYYGPPEDIDELSGALKKCYEKVYDFDAMEEASRKMFEAYNYLSVSEKYINLFQKFLARQKLVKPDVR